MNGDRSDTPGAPHDSVFIRPGFAGNTSF